MILQDQRTQKFEYTGKYISETIKSGELRL